ncbi:conserved hypothetical protein [Thermotomaculum hydrothermale]|uniref:Arginase/agmatinase/formiminoglutamase n=1 Tax=Thermotomaculum hydrothermale TaxID=981385 RepID=A0A7R6SYN3_9BACT|nr:arginase family protein [Thermotomaculum hydrothermale]BBB31907.1 conserved hypothetical protein [Thermotomaculum hydrothermale]
MFSVLILHTENSYLLQKSILKKAKCVDLRDIPEKKLMATFETLKRIEEKLPQKQHLITFLGKGDYHYLSYLFLKRIKEEFTLVVFDNHLDNQPVFDKNFISCGSWLNNAITLPLLKKIIVIKPEIESTNNTKIKVIDFNPDALEKELENEKRIYVSIDKDILDEKFLKTNWDGGNFSPEMIVELLEIIPKEKILGADICGEPDDFNLFDIQKSEKINNMLLKALTKAPVLRREFIS